jgi:hypothetical protein
MRFSDLDQLGVGEKFDKQNYPLTNVNKAGIGQLSHVRPKSLGWPGVTRFGGHERPGDNMKFDEQQKPETKLSTIW